MERKSLKKKREGEREFWGGKESTTDAESESREGLICEVDGSKL